MHALLLTLALAAPQEPGVFDLGPEIHPGSGSFDRFGWAVDADGEWAVVGSTDIVELGTPKGLGGAWVYRRSAKGTWIFETELDPPGDENGTGYGHSVAIDGGRIVVGAPQDDEAGLNSGAAHLFELVDGETWKFDTKLLPTAPALPEGFGRAVDVDGDRVLVGAPNRTNPQVTSGRGAADLFELEPGGWVRTRTFQQENLGPATAPQLALGASVAIGGNVVVLGAPAFFTGTEAGSFTVHVQTSGIWNASPVLVPAAAGPFDEVGAAVATDGSRVYVGAPRHDVVAQRDGAVWVYVPGLGGTWVEQERLTSPTPTDFAQFGFALALDDGVLAVGEPSLSPEGTAGGVHLFELGVSGSTHRSFLQSPLAADDDATGRTVALSGGFVFSGSPFRDLTATESGAIDVWFDHDAVDQAAPVSFGTGTPGCDGTQTLSTNLPALIDSSGFEVLCSNAPPSAAGFLYLADAADVGGSDPLGLGLTVHLDLVGTSFLLALPMFSTTAGDGFAGVPLPDAPALVGLPLTFQALWPWTSCAPSPLGLSTSRGLTVEFGAL